MAGKLKQRKIKRKIYSWWGVAILVVIVFFFLNNTWDVYLKYSASKQNIEGLEEQYKNAQNREQELGGKIDNLRTEKGLEQEIREKFNVAKEGEKVVVIVNSNVEEKPAEPRETGLFEELWQDVLDIFR